MYFVVVIMALIIVGAMWFFFATAVQSVQESVNPELSSDKFASQGNWNSFNLANSFMNNIWTYVLAFLVLGLAYYGYNESQRRT